MLNFFSKGKTQIGLITSVILILVVLAFSTVLYLKPKPIKPEPGKPNSYEECALAGYPVLESYPPTCSVPNGQTFTEDIGNELDLTEEIRVSNPRPNQVIDSPLTISGEAVGSWLFEANTDYVLYDEENNVIAKGLITAQGDWMTENLVPFTGSAEFKKPEEKKGKLIINKSNPSGLEENAKQLIIPVYYD